MSALAITLYTPLYEDVFELRMYRRKREKGLRMNCLMVKPSCGIREMLNNVLKYEPKPIKTHPCGLRIFF